MRKKDEIYNFYKKKEVRKTFSEAMRRLPWYIKGKLFALKYGKYLDRVGKHLKIRGDVVISKRSRKNSIDIGNNISLIGDFNKTTLMKITGRLSIDNGSFVNRGSEIYSSEYVSIGKKCMIGPNNIIRDSDAHRFGKCYSGPVKIGNDVWTGNNVIILKGVTIGDRSVVGAGSVVTKDVSGETVVAGNPAKKIKDVDQIQGGKE